MTDNTRDRYNFENLPISDQTKAGLTKENIDQISTIGRMLSLQDDFIESILKSIHGTVVNIEKVLLTIDGRLNSIETRLTQAEEKVSIEEKRIEEHEIRLNKKRDDIKEINDRFEEYKEHMEYLAKVKPTLETIQKVWRFWTWKENWKKIIGAILAGLVVVFVLFWMFLSLMKFKGFVNFNEPNKITDMGKIEADIKTGHISPITRAAHPFHITGTKAYRDSVNDAIIEQNEKDIQASIDARNKIYAEK